MNKRIELLRDHYTPKWDDLHEARVLQRVLEEVHQPVAKSGKNWRGLAGIGLGVVAAAAGVFLFLGSTVRPLSVATTGNTEAAKNHAHTSVLKFADGSHATLETGAIVDCVHQSTASVLLSQQTGAVHYDVRPDVSRPFVVLARGVRVEVVGTAFDVSVSDSVQVRVTRGRVRVVSTGRQVELGAGEEMRVVENGSATAASGTAVEAPNGVPGATPVTRSPHAEGVAAKAQNSIEDLLAQADDARRRGNSALAAEKLTQLAKAYPRDPRTPSALFTLARLEESRGRHARAAELFGNVSQRAPNGPLAEDALAGQARALKSSGNLPAAQKSAAEYLRRYPFGPHTARMRQISN